MFDMTLVGDEATAVRKAVNMGIDSRLEGFTKSKFEWVVHTLDGQFWVQMPQDERPHGLICKLHCSIPEGEMSVLLRRLLEIEDIDGDEEAGRLADDIVMVHYGKEIE